MTEDTQPTDTGDVVIEPSLDDVIAEYKPQPVAPVVMAPAQPAPAVVPAVSATVDPLNEAEFGNFATQVQTGQSVLTNQLQDVQAKLTRIEEESAKLQIEADISDAVSRINEGLDLDPKLVRIHLEYTAQEKPGFKALWDNRAQNPAGFQAALKAMSREIGSTYSVQTDSELLANQKAVQQSQQSRSTKAAPDGSGNKLEDRLAAAKSDGEFQQEWQRIIRG